jgi:hypothetical protein
MHGLKSRRHRPMTTTGRDTAKKEHAMTDPIGGASTQAMHVQLAAKPAPSGVDPDHDGDVDGVGGDKSSAPDPLSTSVHVDTKA